MNYVFTLAFHNITQTLKLRFHHGLKIVGKYFIHYEATQLTISMMQYLLDLSKMIILFDWYVRKIFMLLVSSNELDLDQEVSHHFCSLDKWQVENLSQNNLYLLTASKHKNIVSNL